MPGTAAARSLAANQPFAVWRPIERCHVHGGGRLRDGSNHALRFCCGCFANPHDHDRDVIVGNLAQ